MTSRTVRRLALWVATALAVGALLLWYRWECRRAAGEAPERRLPDAPRAVPAVLLGLESSGAELSDRDLAMLFSAAEAWRRRGSRGSLVVWASDRTAGMCAKVVLHSCEAPPGAVAVRSEPPEAEWAAGRTVLVAPGTTKETADRLRRAGADVSELPAAPWKRLPAPDRFAAAAVVLGNEPLDGSTPTIDLVRRVLKAVEFYRSNGGARLVLTGGPTAGGLSEARMMAVIAASRGVPTEGLILEEAATSTRQNAVLSAELLKGAPPERVVVISKASHLEVAMPLFRRVPVFARAEPLASKVTDQEIIAQMEDYLRLFDCPRVRGRLEALRAGWHGVD